MSIGGDFPNWFLLSHHLGISYKNGDRKWEKKYLQEISTLCVTLFKVNSKSGKQKPFTTTPHTL